VGKLVDLKLVEKKELRVMEDNTVKRIVGYRLTPEGFQLASRLCGGSNDGPDVQPGLEPFNEEIMSCIEAALDSFGPKFKSTVYERFEITHKMGCKEIPNKISEFTIMLKQYFGLGAAGSLEELILTNLSVSFSVETKGKNLSEIVSQIKSRNNLTISARAL
jgi:hypothetical protein